MIRKFIEKHRLFFRIAAAVIAFAMIAFIIDYAIELLGNPISYFAAKNNVEKYVAENYGSEGYYVQKVGYNFKFKTYYAFVTKPDTLDCYFSVDCDWWGRVAYDNYKSSITEKGNTFVRLMNEYSAFGKKLKEIPHFKYNANALSESGDHFSFSLKNEYNYNDSGLSQDELQIDGVYNIYELGKQFGQLIIYIYTDDLSPENAAEILLTFREYADKCGASFYTADLSLCDKTSSEGWKSYNMLDFRYSDIYPEGIVERVKANHERTEEYYRAEDEKRRLEEENLK